MNINIKKVSLTATIPTYGTPGAAGLDLYADLLFPIKLRPGVRFTCPTGVAIELPYHYEAQIRPRSGLAKNHGITVLNAPGTIDSDYRGEIGVILFNSGDEEFEIKTGDRIAQMVIAPFVRATLVEEVALGETERGEGGFGSTGN